MRLLAVDDDALILDLLKTTLLANGYDKVVTAGDAKQAAAIISGATEPFDAFLLDIMMPEVTGIELARWIRKIPQYQAAPILMITSMSEKTFIDSAFKAGASDYITKPFDPVEVVTRVRLAERQYQSSRQVRDSSLQIKALTAQLEDHYRAALSEPVVLEDVDGLIEYMALQNYLLQLSRGDFFATSVLAMRIVDVGNIYTRCSASLFRDILADVAECALSALAQTECIMAYAGNGAFAGVIAFPEQHDFDEIELMINLMIERLDLTDDKQQPIEVRVAVGKPIPVGITKSGRDAVAKMQRAVEDLNWNQPKPGRRQGRAATARSLFSRAFSMSF
ncbi:response regulator [Gemmobacter lutimaris]|uniref:Response regulator n=1 Tax=Gemmobacter lutimaris TaxID=2306023 RepID=A0A398BLH5_9RHOB|nr:response regulator [Gemmobacter lutimaris]RID91569.1 response regulator [Gemmobacter lutimaris]